MQLINGHAIHIEKYGETSGRVIFLLHHGLGSTRSWNGQIKALNNAGYQVIAYDRWGYGQSDYRETFNPPDFSDDISDLRSIYDHLNIDNAALIGHSDGGTISLYFAARYPRRVSRLVTVAAHVFIEAKMEAGIRDIRHSCTHDPVLREKLEQSHGDKTSALIESWCSGWQAKHSRQWNMLSSLEKIACPTLVIQGELDEHATLNHARKISNAIASAELSIFPGAPHMLPQMRKTDFNQKVLSFLQ